MEWLLRSARQMPLHDLNREKAVVRRRMRQLEAELSGYGELTRGLAHYALGRGHLALHEYPQALTELRAAMAHGNQRAEVQYALGLALGKHFEQALYEARLSGGGSWAERQLKEIEPRYLRPAIASLSQSRRMRLDAPEYLEALLSFYQRDYAAALLHTRNVLADSPWMYEAAKLAGDVHHEQALRARDSGRYDEAQGKQALETTHSPERHADAWWTLAVTHLRLAQALPDTTARLSHCEQGLNAIEQLFAINPSHELGRAAERELRQLMTKHPPILTARTAATTAHSTSRCPLGPVVPSGSTLQ